MVNGGYIFIGGYHGWLKHLECKRIIAHASSGTRALRENTCVSAHAYIYTYVCVYIHMFTYVFKKRLVIVPTNSWYDVTWTDVYMGTYVYIYAAYKQP